SCRLSVCPNSERSSCLFISRRDAARRDSQISGSPGLYHQKQTEDNQRENIRAEADYNPISMFTKEDFVAFKGEAEIFAALIKSRLKEGNETCSPAKR
ncbi:MAG: hypothetical protein AAB112_08505, partial [Thermodesulfobacteriota bacterium]